MNSSSSESCKSDTPDTPHTVPWTIPKISQYKYNKTYDSFISWKNEVGINNFGEDVMMAYFQYLAETKLPSTLYATYSMLKATMIINNDINIGNYKKLTAYLKQISKGFKSKKSKFFTRDDVDTFLKEAPDKTYLCVKVVLILGVHGACRIREIMNISVDDIERHSDDLLLVKLEDSRTKKNRSFVLRGLDKEILEKYLALRPPDTPIKRVLIRYENGKCVKQVIGKNCIAMMPARIAQYLCLPNPKLYTGHSFRRTAHTLPSDLRCNFELRHCEETHCDDEKARLREVYIETQMETQTAKDNEDLLNIDQIKQECTLDLELSSPHSYTSETLEAVNKPDPITQKYEKVSETPPAKEEGITHKIGSAKVTIKENTDETRTISIPGKNITIIFENCENVSNININF